MKIILKLNNYKLAVIILGQTPMIRSLMGKLYRAFISHIYEYCDIWKPLTIWENKMDSYYQKTMRKIGADSLLLTTTPSKQSEDPFTLLYLK